MTTPLPNFMATHIMGIGTPLGNPPPPRGGTHIIVCTGVCQRGLRTHNIIGEILRKRHPWLLQVFYMLFLLQILPKCSLDRDLDNFKVYHLCGQ